MQLQKFVGNSMPVVLSNLKDALGSDAIILANRRVGDHIEIIATGSLDESSIDNAELFNSNELVDPTLEKVKILTPTDDVSVSTVTSKVNAEQHEAERSASESAPSWQQVSVSQDIVHAKGDHSDSETRNQQSNSDVHPSTAQILNAERIDAPSQFKSRTNNDTTATSEVSEVVSTVDVSKESSLTTSNQTNTVTEPEVDSNNRVDSRVDSAVNNAKDKNEFSVASEDVIAAINSAMESSTGVIADSITSKINKEVEEKLQQFHTTMDKRLSQLEVNLWGEKDPVKSKHLQTLLEIGLGAELAVALVNRVDGNPSFEEALRISLSDLANTLPVASDRTLTHEGVTIVSGPSGSGKTTTLLKLAMQKKIMSGADSVVMICADANRTGVFEALSAYGKAMGVSVFSASTQRELQELLTFYAKKELVLVDQPFQNELVEFVIPEASTDDLNARSVRHLLVLPATIQSSVAESVVTEFSKHASARCVITHLDRPCRIGELFTTMIRHNLRVAYWSECGDVETPLNTASAQTLVAAAMAMGRRLEPSEDDRYLMNMIHPRFSASVVPMLRANL